MVTRLQELNAQRTAQREALRADVNRQLRAVLAELGTGFHVIIFGSLIKSGRFHEESDVDIALESLPPGWSLFGLTGWLSEELGRAVDVILLPECRFRAAIEREGETWTS